MDVTCANCGEPWDSHHLLYDEVGEWDVAPHLARDFARNPRFGGPDDPVRLAAQHAGWQFAGETPLAVLRCPACAGRESLPDAMDRVQRTRLAVQMLEGDEDGLITELADR